jgi:hypothetical protein
MKAIQSRPIDNDADFLAIQDAINRLLARFGFPLVRLKGSASWLAGAGRPSQSKEVFFKLLYLGRGKGYVFGIRRDFAASIEKLREIRWPISFVVMPKTEVAFVGFNVPAEGMEVAKQRVEKILSTLPEPDSSLAISLEEGDDSEFDRQLQSLFQKSQTVSKVKENSNA